MAFNRGWGAPSGAGHNRGWGAPSSPVTAGASNRGWGAPSLSVSAVTVSGQHVLPDDGGVLVTMAGAFADRGPYHVRLRNVAGTLFPTDGTSCYSGVLGFGEDCYAAGPVGAWDSLAFALPPLPVGVYDIRLRWGVSFLSEAFVLAAIRVQRRGRAVSVYRMRSAVPDWMPVGARTVGQEPTI